MRIVITSLAVLALAGCGQSTDATNEVAEADANMAMEANMATPADFEIKQTSWEFTRDGKAIVETVDASGNYVAWSGEEHIDHGTAMMKDGKACFVSAMDQQGEVCWTTAQTDVGQTFETTSDKGETLTVKRIAFVEVPEAVKP